MKRIFIVFSLFSFVFSQGNGKFYETEEPVDPTRKKYLRATFNFASGYMIHENSQEQVKISYGDFFHGTAELNYYLLMGLYLNASFTYTPTSKKHHAFSDYNNNLVPTKDTDLTLYSPHIGFRFYSFKNQSMNAPWYFQFGVGKDIFVSPNKSVDRFSFMIEIGKIFDYKLFGNANFYMGAAVHMYDELGWQDYYTNYGIYRERAYVTRNSLKINVGFHLPLTNDVVLH
jgi:hypothetical protein